MNSMKIIASPFLTPLKLSGEISPRKNHIGGTKIIKMPLLFQVHNDSERH
jgi:hypothetical protein